VFPDLHIREAGQEKIVKLELSVQPPSRDVVKIISQAMFEASIRAGLKLPSAAVLYADVARGRMHRGARLGARMGRDIESACLNIAAIWPTL